MLDPEYILLAKQPIYDMAKNCHAYELLFRTPMGSSAADFGAEIATSQVLVNHCASVSEQADDAGLPVFINVDSQFILEYDSIPVSPDKVIIELTEGLELSDALIEAIKRWRKLGFTFAFDCYDFDAKWDELLLIMDYIKVDVLSLEQDVVAKYMGAVNTSDHHWIAKRVEDEEAFEFCKDQGFNFAQGYFLAKPKPVLGKSIRPGTAVTVKLIKELDRPGITMHQIADLVSQDPKLTVQMLKIVNSSLFSLPKPVDNLHAALVYLGVDMLRQWAMMIAFLSNGNVHVEACRLVLLRAKACEMLCDKGQAENASSAFLVGLVSGVDILLKVSARDFISQVSLSKDVNEAVLDSEGELGGILSSVCSLEYTVAQAPKNVPDISKELLGTYEEASKWVSEVMNTLKAK